jgi:two-component system response regulator YesN
MAMTKVMIVDDEILVRIGLRSTIAWEQNGFTVTADAANATQAVEKFDAADPDILITDIRMPGMDGLELIETLKQKKPGLKMIILTNYDNFDYAKQALELGADEYILKTTLDNQTLFPVLKKLQEEIEQERVYHLQYEQLQQKALMGLSYIKRNFAERLLMGRITSEEWRQFQNELNLQWEKNSFQLALIKRKAGLEGQKTNSQSLQLIEEIVEKIHGSLVWELPNSSKWAIIYSFAPEEENNFCKQVIPFNIRQVKSCLKQYLQMSVVAILGQPTHDYNRLAEKWQGLCKIEGYSIFWPERELIFDSDIPSEQMITPIGYSQKDFANKIRFGQNDKIQEMLGDLFAEITETRSLIILNQIWHELLGEIYRLVRENGLLLSTILTEKEQEGDYLETFGSIAEMNQWFNQKFRLLIEQIDILNVKPYSFAIRQAICYLKEHYTEDINLDGLARKVGLSKNHFCTLFHSETGQNFVDYLHQIRIEQARDLLATTDLRVSEVGLKVGYHDAKYFTKVFQKYQNCSPSEYRETIINKF